jgi:hypothetical protein
VDPNRQLRDVRGVCVGRAEGLASAGEPEAGQATSTLIGAAGAGLIASALFTTGPVSGGKKTRPVSHGSPNKNAQTAA